MGGVDVDLSLAGLRRQILIPRNTLLFSRGPELELADLLRLRSALLSAKDTGKLGEHLNLLDVNEETMRAIDELHGPEALFRLFTLAGGSGQADFRQYLDILEFGINLRHNLWKDDPVPLVCDNGQLRSGSQLGRLNHRLLSPSLSRKLYNPGDTFGSTVYGIGGPKILISLPFIGATEYGYDAYTNGLDVVTSLLVRGFYGRFKLFDKLDTLNGVKAGYPVWLLWFSMVACHSDLVVFVRRKDEDLSSAQQNEVLFTPDRVQKVDLVLDATELSWAAPADREAQSHQEREVLYLDERGRRISRLEYDAEELRRSGTSGMLDGYLDVSVADGVLAVVDETGHLSYYRESDELYTLSDASDRMS